MYERNKHTNFGKITGSYMIFRKDRKKWGTEHLDILVAVQIITKKLFWLHDIHFVYIIYDNHCDLLSLIMALCLMQCSSNQRRSIKVNDTVLPDWKTKEMMLGNISVHPRYLICQDTGDVLFD